MNNQKSDALVENLQRLESFKVQLDAIIAQLLKTAASRAPLPSDVPQLANNTLAQMQREIKQLQKASRNVSQQMANLQGLVRVSALINSSLEIDRVLNDIMDTVIALTGAERAYIMLTDHQTGELKLRAARNWDQETMVESDVIFSRGVIDEALKKGEPIVTLNAQEDARFADRQSVASHQLRSILCIPLKLQAETVGVLYTDNRVQRGLFDEDTVPLMTAFANQAAIAIVNARRYQTIKTDLDKAQQEVQRLRIQIDQQKLDQQVSEITETDYFKTLEQRAEHMRNQFLK
ncbi:MAG: GAF domain-containing protein [Anaerolineae bacterium]